MAAPDDRPERTTRRRTLITALAVLGSVGLGAAALLPGAEPTPPVWVCYTHHFGPLGSALVADAQHPWPTDWQQFFGTPSAARDAAGAGDPRILRCPEDHARAGADPLADPSYALMEGLERDMPPFLVACWEREVHHVWEQRYRDGRTVRAATAWFHTLGGGDRLRIERYILPPLTDAQAREQVHLDLNQLVGRDRAAIALARTHAAAAAGDAEARGKLRGALQHPDYRHRACAAWALAKAGDRAAIPMLQAALQRESRPSTREEIARALALLGDRAGVPVLLEALKGRDVGGSEPGAPAPPHVRRDRAHAALVSLAGRDCGHPTSPGGLAAWQAWAEGR